MVTEEIKVSKEKVIDIDSAPDYINMMNGIAYACHEYAEYQEGSRNTIAVDLTVGSYMLGLDPLNVLDVFIKYGLIDPVMDDEAPIDRVKRVLLYSESFDWDWMINPDSYVALYVKFKPLMEPPAKEIPVTFKLVD
jgi:hypothetical protein